MKEHSFQSITYSFINLLIFQREHYISYTNNIFIYIILLNNLIIFYYNARKQKEYMNNKYDAIFKTTMRFLKLRYDNHIFKYRTMK